jgi:hypothetical protein
MARISNPFYINMISPTREETAITLALLINAHFAPEEELQRIGESIGLTGNVRQVIDSMGEKLDDDWEEMLEQARNIIAEMKS